MSLLESAIAKFFILAVFCTLINLFGPDILKSDYAQFFIWKVVLYLVLSWITSIVLKIIIAGLLAKGKKQ